MSAKTDKIADWAISTIVLYAVGFVAVCFVRMEWWVPLTTHADRAWLLFCAMTIGGVVLEAKK